mgnify:CR=1 FL=1
MMTATDVLRFFQKENKDLNLSIKEVRSNSISLQFKFADFSYMGAPMREKADGFYYYFNIIGFYVRGEYIVGNIMVTKREGFNSVGEHLSFTDAD